MITIISIVALLVFIVCWVCIIHDFINAPVMDDNGFYEYASFYLCPKCNKRLITKDVSCICETK